MAQELIYTSAPRGLKSGSQGYCTVAMTAGMSAALAARLETMSGYRFAFPPHDPNARFNPVNQSCSAFTLGGRDVVVLSRICSAGFDHTQRSNLLAHHLVLEAGERAVAGPAWVASQTNLFQSVWSGEPHVIDAPKIIVAAPRSLRPASAWRGLTGGAGWAAVMAEFSLANPGAPVALVFNPGTDALALIDEVMALIPGDRRWGIGYSTYLTDLLAGTVCAWRCMLPNAPMLDDMKRNRQALVLDVTTPGRCVATMGGMPFGDLKTWLHKTTERGARLAECAETGADPWPLPAMRPQVTIGELTSSVSTSKSDASDTIVSDPALDESPPEERSRNLADLEFKAAADRYLQLQAASAAISAAAQPSRKRVWPWVAGAALVVGAVAAGVMYSTKPHDADPAAPPIKQPAIVSRKAQTGASEKVAEPLEVKGDAKGNHTPLDKSPTAVDTTNDFGNVAADIISKRTTDKKSEVVQLNGVLTLEFRTGASVAISNVTGISLALPKYMLTPKPGDEKLYILQKIGDDGAFGLPKILAEIRVEEDKITVEKVTGEGAADAEQRAANEFVRAAQKALLQCNTPTKILHVRFVARN